jgi:hypothetical protein
MTSDPDRSYGTNARNNDLSVEDAEKLSLPEKLAKMGP